MARHGPYHSRAERNLPILISDSVGISFKDTGEIKMFSGKKAGGGGTYEDLILYKKQNKTGQTNVL